MKISYRATAEDVSGEEITTSPFPNARKFSLFFLTSHFATSIHSVTATYVLQTRCDIERENRQMATKKAAKKPAKKAAKKSSKKK